MPRPNPIKYKKKTSVSSEHITTASHSFAVRTFSNYSSGNTEELELQQETKSVEFAFVAICVGLIYFFG